MAYITEDKYIVSEIDGKTYCKDNGTFCRHIRQHGYNHQTYYETFITKKRELCDCGESRVFYKKESRYGPSCGNPSCAAKTVWRDMSEDTRETMMVKRSEYWNSLSREGLDALLDKRKATLIERHGVDHPMKIDGVLEKGRQTAMERHGVIHHSKLDNYTEKMRAAYKEKLGVDHPMHLDSVKNQVAKKLRANAFTPESCEILESETLLKMHYDELGMYGLITKLQASESCVYNALRKYDIYIKKEPASLTESSMVEYIKSISSVDVQVGDKKILNGKELDIYIPTLKLAIECNGVYWHSEISGNKTKTYHKEKTDQCLELGIRLIHITDDDWIYKNELMKSLISTALGKNQVIYARKCQISKIETKVAREFLRENHRQGCCQSSVNYGLYHDGELVSVMTFGKSRYDKNHQWELLRLCNKKFLTIVGGASKMYAKFLKENEVNSVISYSNTDWNTGNIYTTLGMVFIRESGPSPIYINKKRKIVNRLVVQKHKLKETLDSYDETLTAWENLVNNGYDRLWNSGNKVYSWRREV